MRGTVIFCGDDLTLPLQKITVPLMTWFSVLEFYVTYDHGTIIFHLKTLNITMAATYADGN